MRWHTGWGMIHFFRTKRQDRYPSAAGCIRSGRLHTTPFPSPTSSQRGEWLYQATSAVTAACPDG